MEVKKKLKVNPRYVFLKKNRKNGGKKSFKFNLVGNFGEEVESEKFPVLFQYYRQKQQRKSE